MDYKAIFFDWKSKICLKPAQALGDLDVSGYILVIRSYQIEVVMRWAFNPAVMRHLLNFWPPFFFNGIKIVELAADYRYAKVTLNDRPWRRNINSSQFGGAMFAMTDPIYPLMLMGALGKEYLVWDKKADIDYIKPGHGKLTAEFWLGDSLLTEIKAATELGDKYFPQFLVHLKNQQGDIVCEVNRTVYVRKKRKHRPGEHRQADVQAQEQD